MKVIPTKPVFGHDLIVQTFHTVNWRKIYNYKQKYIDRNNIQENDIRIEHYYKFDELVLLHDKKL